MPDIVLDAKIPPGPLAEKWSRHQQDSKLINPANKRKFTVLVVGSGLAGASAAATLSELGYKVKCFCFQDSPRRAHSIAAQGGINAAKNYQNDGDSVHRLFYDTIKGGDFRAREANVYRLAEVTALHGVVEQPPDAVAVVLVILRRVDAALRGDGMRAARRVLEAEALDVVTELAERRGSRAAGEARAHDDHGELPLVRRVHKLHLELVLVPLLLEGAGRNFRLEV